MEVFRSLTAKQLQDILINIYNKGNEKKDIQVVEVVNEIKQSILALYGSTLKK